jgi:hypothetical protein
MFIGYIIVGSGAVMCMERHDYDKTLGHLQDSHTFYILYYQAISKISATLS